MNKMYHLEQIRELLMSIKYGSIKDVEYHCNILSCMASKKLITEKEQNIADILIPLIDILVIKE